LGTGAKGFWAGIVGLGTGAEGLGTVSIVFGAGTDGLGSSPKDAGAGIVGGAGAGNGFLGAGAGAGAGAATHCWQNDSLVVKLGSTRLAQALLKNIASTVAVACNLLYHSHKLWLNLDASLNMSVITVTLLTFQSARG